MSFLYKIINETDKDMDNIASFVDEYFPYIKKETQFNKPVIIKLVSDPENASNDLGKTGFYDPQEYSITVYCDNRHPKDIMRSINHELHHHIQNCRGEFDPDTLEKTGESGYVLNDEKLEELEREAYEGQLRFRRWEDQRKQQYNETLYKKLFERFVKK